MIRKLLLVASASAVVCATMCIPAYASIWKRSVLSNKDWSAIKSDAKRELVVSVNLVAKVEDNAQSVKGAEATKALVSLDPPKTDHTVLLWDESSNKHLKAGEYIRIKGFMYGNYKQKDPKGIIVTYPLVVAHTVSKISASNQAK